MVGFCYKWFLVVVVKLTFTFCRHLLQPIYLLLCLFLYISYYFSAHSVYIKCVIYVYNHKTLNHCHVCSS